MKNMEENYNLAKWLNDELTGAELKEFEASADYDLYKKIKEHSALLKTSDFNNQDAMLNTIIASEKQAKKVVPLYGKWYYKVAAILVIGLCVSYFLKNSFVQTINVGNGAEMAEVLLPDNSKVLLNDGSNLSYSTWNWDNNRALHLKGEAYFKVAKGKKFEVNTNLGKVSVLGTQFNML
jgi:transmembrane sensor